MPERTNKPYTVAAMRHGGTHLITPIVRKLTGKTVYSPKGNVSLHCIPSRIVIVFTRDPRNRIVSNLRYKTGLSLERSTPDERDEALLKFLKTSKQPGHDLPIDFMHKWAAVWAGMADKPGKRAVKLMRFESLVAPDTGLQEVELLVTFLHQAQDEPLRASAAEAYDYSLGKSGTWTGRHSSWREWFGPQSRLFWHCNFGGALTTRMGYQVEEGI